MNMRCPRIKARNHHGGFTLVELIIVIAILSILAAVSMPAISSLMRGSNLNRASSMITDELTLARQTALSRNADVEVRFYQTGTASSPTDLQYRAFRSFIANQPLEPIRTLPSQVIISSNPTYSSLLDYTNAGRAGLSNGSETLPGATTTSNYVSFNFRATGGTGLTPVTGTLAIWGLALYTENDPVNSSTGLPNNFVTVQVDPVTGNERTYRP